MMPFILLGPTSVATKCTWIPGKKKGEAAKALARCNSLLWPWAAAVGSIFLSILKKGRQQVDKFSVDLTAERAEGEVPSLFTKVHAHYTLEGDLDSDKVRRAIALSIEKYCSVSKTLEATAEITYSFTVNNVEYA